MHISRIMHIALNNNTLEQYSQTGVLPRFVRPSHCKFCNSQHGFHRHSHYHRKCIYRKGYGWLPVTTIQRFLCTACGKVFSLLFPGTYKWQRAEHAIQQEVAIGNVPIPETRENFSLRTLNRWRQKWNIWAASIQQMIIQWLLMMLSTLSLDVTRKEARNPVKYLSTLFQRMPMKMPAVLEIIGVSRFVGVSMNKIPQSLSVVFPL